MSNYKATTKISFLGTVFSRLILLLQIKDKLAKDSFKQLKSYRDTITPVVKGYLKEVIGDVTVFWINKEKRGNGILVFLPGGGFIIGPIKLHWDYCEKMSKKLNMAVLVIHYHLAPKHPFPNGLNSIINVINALQNRGVLKDKWFLAGDSSGGNLTLSTCYKLFELKALLPQKILLLYPSVDMDIKKAEPEAKKIEGKDVLLSVGFTKKVLAAYVYDQDVSNPLLSPVNGNVGILPPVLLQHGTNDILVPGSRGLAHKLEAVGKAVQYEEYEGMFHGFILAPWLPEAKMAIRSQVKFLTN